MNRKQFLASMGGVPFLPPWRDDAVSPFGGIMAPVATPEERADYAYELLTRLCDGLGPRPTGSLAFARGARVLHDEMGRSLPDVEFDRYSFERWELIEEPEFRVGRQQLEVCPLTGSEGTPPEGIRGKLERVDGGYQLLDRRTGLPAARIRSNPLGRAIPGFQRRTYPPSVPGFGVGRQDIPLIEKGIRDGEEAFLRAWVRFVPNAPGMNVVGRIPGRQEREILFVAHADSVYTSPGAHDNMASVIIMLIIARAAAATRWNHTLTFLATDGEEYGYLGAANYGARRAAAGTMDRIDYVVNFDSLTYGPNLWINSLDDGLKELIRSIHHDLQIAGEPRYDANDGFVMDSLAFRPSGARAVYVNSRGYDEKTLPVYHRPDDDAGKIPLECVEIGFQVFSEFIRRIDGS
jgi:hypothetical protein